MRLLVIHQNFPGQFAHLVRAWNARPGWEVRGLGGTSAPGLPGFDRLQRYQLARDARPQQHAYLRRMETAVLHGQAAARAMLQMRQQGFSPEVILAHPGWGETLYAKEVFPSARLVHLCEWYYSPHGADLGFDPEFPDNFDDRARVRTWNALHLLNLEQCDAAVSPTHWQKSRHPLAYLERIAVQHEGIAIDRLGPDPEARVRLPDGRSLRPGDPVVTFVARNLEPYRGFHCLVRALQRVQQQHPHCQALIVGAEGISYGRPPPGNRSWREHLLRENPLDPARCHFLGALPYAQYLKVLQVSAAHVYLTYPFVLSWSMLEAMACGALLIASDTPPVREVIRHDQDGWLVGFFDTDALVDRMLQALDAPAGGRPLRDSARQRVRPYNLADGVAGYERLLLGGR